MLLLLDREKSPRAPLPLRTPALPQNGAGPRTQAVPAAAPRLPYAAKKKTLPTQSAPREDSRTVWTHPAFTYHHVRLRLIGLPNHPTTENSGACPPVVQIPKKAGPDKRKGCAIENG